MQITKNTRVDLSRGIALHMLQSSVHMWASHEFWEVSGNKNEMGRFHEGSTCDLLKKEFQKEKVKSVHHKLRYHTLFTFILFLTSTPASSITNSLF